mmetsp:Transcript_89181/g.248155  ORF Transcript_89181/g.248155 Transcript_89181/m.248155 type:complete len:205 (+) Transcript_89181:250-864(+)
MQVGHAFLRRDHERPRREILELLEVNAAVAILVDAPESASVLVPEQLLLFPLRIYHAVSEQETEELKLKRAQRSIMVGVGQSEQVLQQRRIAVVVGIGMVAKLVIPRQELLDLVQASALIEMRAKEFQRDLDVLAIVLSLQLVAPPSRINRACFCEIRREHELPQGQAPVAVHVGFAEDLPVSLQLLLADIVQDVLEPRHELVR